MEYNLCLNGKKNEKKFFAGIHNMRMMMKKEEEETENFLQTVILINVFFWYQ